MKFHASFNLLNTVTNSQEVFVFAINATSEQHAFQKINVVKNLVLSSVPVFVAVNEMFIDGLGRCTFEGDYISIKNVIDIKSNFNYNNYHLVEVENGTIKGRINITNDNVLVDFINICFDQLLLENK